MNEKNNRLIHTCTSRDAIFPSQLKDLTPSPHTLYYRGVLTSTSFRIALVGTRKASILGTQHTRRLAHACATRGWCVVSGLAFGIDTAAHNGALDAHGTTWAILAHGLETIQPKSNTTLAQNILNTHGALISEYPIGTPARAYHFLERNRIIAGVSDALVVIEAPRTSGSLVTARHALHQHKPVFVFPGPAGSSTYAGSHALIREGARLVESIDDIVCDLRTQSLIPSTHTTLPEILSDIEHTILSYLSTLPRAICLDDIIDHIHASYKDTTHALQRLLVSHYIEEDGLQHYRIILPKKEK